MAIHLKKDGTEQSGLVDDNVIQPFSLDKSSVRGRMVRMGDVLTDIMRRHNYPAPVSALLSEVLALCLMLSAMLKYKGVFSLQIKGDGAIKTLVADVTSGGEVRAYAGFNETAVKKAAKRKKDIDNHYFYLLGSGHMAFTVDHKDKSDSSYQGIVELKGDSLTESVEYYFKQSEQIKTSFKLAIHPQDNYWRAGGIMIQQIPKDDSGYEPDIEANIEDWNRASMLLSTCSEGEILSPILHSADVLYRLFHEETIRIYTPQHIRFKCRCRRKKVIDVIRTLPREEIEDICKKDQKISVICEFCSEEYNIEKSELDDIYQGKN